MRPLWFIVAAIWLVLPVFGVWNIFFNGFQVSGMWEYVVLFGMLFIGLIVIILGFVQKNGVYVTGTMMKKTDVAIKDAQFGERKDYDSSSQGALPMSHNDSGFSYTIVSDNPETKHEHTWKPSVLNWKPYFDPEKGSWIVGTSEFPLIENISEVNLKIIDHIYVIQPEDVIEMVDTHIRDEVYKFALGTDLKTIQSLIHEDAERELFVEVFVFVIQIKTLENAKQDSIYNPVFIAGQERARNAGLNELDLQNNFSRFSWQQAEDLVGKLFEKKEYSVTVGVPTADGGTKRQGDFGIDVEAKNESEYLGIQVKHWSMDVGFEDVAKTLGVAQKFNKVIIVSTKSGFTSQALEHAQKNPYLIELWDSNKFKNELRQHLLNNSNLTKSKGTLPKEQKLCSECKTGISNSTKFCPKCGKKQ